MMERLKGDKEGIARAAAILRAGGLVAFPTDTVYGLGADARSEAAVQRLARAKGRPEGKPFSLLVASVEMARAIAVFDQRAEILARTFWPGALTLVLPPRAEAGIAPRATAGRAGIGLRLPDHPATCALLEAFAGPVAAPSANPSGAPSPATAGEVERGLAGRLDALLDAPPAPNGRDSCVIDLTTPRPRLLRAGEIPPHALEAALSALPGETATISRSC